MPQDGIIKEVGEENVEADLRGIVCPRFANAHVHVGDSAFKDPPFLPLCDLVGPGGLKHRLLAETPREPIVEGMRRSLQEMVAQEPMHLPIFGRVDRTAYRGCWRRRRICLFSRILGRPCEGETGTPKMLGLWHQQHKRSRSFLAEGRA